MALFFATLKLVVLGTVADFFYTPIWWYTRGLWKQLRGVVGGLQSRQDALAIDVWLKNLFVPMYGQYDLTGRIVSFFMRLVQIIGRGIALVVWSVLLVLWLLVWLVIPVGVGYLIYIQVIR